MPTTTVLPAAEHRLCFFFFGGNPARASCAGRTVGVKTGCASGAPRPEDCGPKKASPACPPARPPTAATARGPAWRFELHEMMPHSSPGMEAAEQHSIDSGILRFRNPSSDS